MKENKFMMGEEEDNKATTTAAIPNSSPTVTTTVHKKQPTRHHVKRRSSGRVHVAKLAPMARANAAHTDSEAELLDESENNRPVMRRSQSQRSLHRMSFDRKGFATLTPRRKSTASEKPIVADMMVSSPPADNTTDEQQEQEQSPTPPKIQYNNETTSSTHSTSNPASLSSRVIAAPIEQTFNAVANNLVIPKKAVYPTIVSPLKADIQTRKQFLRSQFVASSYDESSHLASSLPKRHGNDSSPFHMPSGTATRPNVLSSAASNNTRSNSNSSTSNINSMSRTQQKLMLQRQQAQVEDETSPIHPRNMQKINKELEILGRQYRCIKRYEDPMRSSLGRCLEKMDLQQHSNNTPSNNPTVTRLQLGANKHSMSTSVVPTVSASPVTVSPTLKQQQHYIPHLEQRQIAHRHHHLKAVALSRANNPSQNNTFTHGADELKNSNDKNNNGILGFPWNATAAFLDRMFYGANNNH